MTIESTAAKPKYRPTPPRLVQVKKVVDTSPHLRRVTFYSPTLHNYPTDCAGAHLKVFLPLAHQTQPELPVLGEKGPQWPAAEVRPIVRTYSVRAIRAELCEIDIEFALHDHSGPAVNFARNAKSGDWIGITNPGGPETMLPAAEYSYLVGDPSSLPAIAALLETLPANAQGHAIIRVDTPQDVLNLVKPAGFELSWVIGGTEKPMKLSPNSAHLNCRWRKLHFGWPVKIGWWCSYAVISGVKKAANANNFMPFPIGVKASMKRTIITNVMK